MLKTISGTTRLLGLIGTPVDHSKSPVMYNHSFQKLNLDYAYLAFDVNVDKVPDAINAIKTFNMRGANVTMPCKNEVVKHMDDLSPAARIIGAVNTIVNDNGKLTGHITDGVGFVTNARENGVEVKDKDLVILGAGGAATAIQVQCALDGAKSIAIFNVKDDFYKRAENTVKSLAEEVPGCNVTLHDLEDQELLKSKISECDVLINGTLVGMHPYEDQCPLKDTSILNDSIAVADVVYNPKETVLIKEAKAKGCKTVGGLGMLLWQGAEAFKLYTDLEMPVEEVKANYFS